MPTPDQTDWKIIDVLKENSRLSSSKISKKTGIPITTVFNRMKKLEKEGVIKNYTVNLDPHKLDKHLLAYVFAFVNKNTTTSLGDRLKQIPGVEHLSFISGRYDVVLIVRVKDIAFLNDVTLDKLRRLPEIGRTETFIAVEEVK